MKGQALLARFACRTAARGVAREGIAAQILGRIWVIVLLNSCRAMALRERSGGGQVVAQAG